jgi:hypothetical protein
MRVSFGAGNDYWFDASRADWSDLALSRPSAATLSITVNVLPNATITGSSATTNSVTLNYTRTNYAVMIVRSSNGPVSWTPPNGVSPTNYANGFVTNGNTIVDRQNFGANITDSGLQPGTTYHYKVFSENWGYFSAGVETNVTTPRPTISFTGSFSAISTTYGTPTASASTVTVTGSNLAADLTATAPAGFEVSSNGTTWGSTATFTPTSGSVTGTLRVRLPGTASVASSPYSGNVQLSSSGASSVNVSVPSSTVAAASLASNQITLTPGAGNAYTASGPSGSTFDITYSGRTTNGVTTIHTNAATAPTAAGYYTVTATATGNYTGSSSTNYFVAGLVAAADSLQSPTAVMNILHGALLGNDRRIDSSGDASTNGLSITAVANGTGSATLGNPFIAFNSGGPGPRTFTYTLSHSGQTAIGTVTVTAMNLQANAPSLSITNLPIVAFYDAGVNETTATVTLVGDPGKMYYVQYCGEMGQSWQDAGGWESGTGTFQVTILQEGNHETDWENSMFFKAQVTNP